MAERALWNEYIKNKSDEARQQLIIENLPLVKKVAGRILVKLPNHLDKEDLISFGILGLIDAVEKYNPEQCVQFSSYAYTRIKGSIYDEIRRQNILPRSVVQQIKDFIKAQTELENSLGEEATNQQIAQRMNISENELEQILCSVNTFSMVSVDEVLELGENESATRIDSISDDKAADPSQEIEEIERKEILAKGIDALNERDRLIISLYYYEELTLAEIGVILQVSESRVCQLHSRALTRLKSQLEIIKFC